MLLAELRGPPTLVTWTAHTEGESRETGPAGRYIGSVWFGSAPPRASCVVSAPGAPCWGQLLDGARSTTVVTDVGQIYLDAGGRTLDHHGEGQSAGAKQRQHGRVVSEGQGGEPGDVAARRGRAEVAEQLAAQPDSPPTRIDHDSHLGQATSDLALITGNPDPATIGRERTQRQAVDIVEVDQPMNGCLAARWRAQEPRVQSLHVSVRQRAPHLLSIGDPDRPDEYVTTISKDNPMLEINRVPARGNDRVIGRGHLNGSSLRHSPPFYRRGRRAMSLG